MDQELEKLRFAAYIWFKNYGNNNNIKRNKASLSKATWGKQK
jgi:hypothetical protein